jgi:hypothetical protein
MSTHELNFEEPTNIRQTMKKEVSIPLSITRLGRCCPNIHPSEGVFDARRADLR